MDHDQDLALALRLADAADAISMRYFLDVDLAVEHKPDSTPVTMADRGVETAIREILAAERPDDAVVGEEFGSVGEARRRWIVDPVDGTKNYIRGVPVWATLIALQVDGIGTVGAVSAPALGRRWWAHSGGGAFADGRRITVSDISELADASLSYSSLSGWESSGHLDGFLELTRAVWRTRGFGDFWSYMLVAEGAVDIAAEPEVSLWDLAALQVIVEEAGGRFSDLHGIRTADGGSALATNGALHNRTLTLLRDRRNESSPSGP
ncbi:MAG: histidinol-phosphatase [Mycobacteriales bacterium]